MLATLCPFGMRPHKPGAGIGIQSGSPFFLSSLDMAGTSQGVVVGSTGGVIYWVGL